MEWNGWMCNVSVVGFCVRKFNTHARLVVSIAFACVFPSGQELSKRKILEMK
jgi:hypothetical protein